jgi:hypothetical protein
VEVGQSGRKSKDVARVGLACVWGVVGFDVRILVSVLVKTFALLL